MIDELMTTKAMYLLSRFLHLWGTIKIPLSYKLLQSLRVQAKAWFENNFWTVDSAGVVVYAVV